MQKRFVLGLLLATVAALSAGLSYAPVRHEEATTATTAASPRTSQIIGFGLVVGLDGTGSKSTFTQQIAVDMLQRLGVTAQIFSQLPSDAVIGSTSMSAVMVTAEFGPQVRRGRRLDVTVAAIDDATSLAGGTLLMTSLKGPNGVVCAQALGPVSASDSGAKAWRIRGGAVAEKNGTVFTGLMGHQVFVFGQAR